MGGLAVHSNQSQLFIIQIQINFKINKTGRDLVIIHEVNLVICCLFVISRDDTWYLLAMVVMKIKNSLVKTTLMEHQAWMEMTSDTIIKRYT